MSNLFKTGMPQKSSLPSDAQRWVPPLTPPGVFPYNVFEDLFHKNRLMVSVTRDGKYILAYFSASENY